MATSNAGLYLGDPEAKLEESFLEQYLQSRGYTLESIQSLPEAARKLIMAEACTYASNKLAELQDVAHLVHDLHTHS